MPPACRVYRCAGVTVVIGLCLLAACGSVRSGSDSFAPGRFGRAVSKYGPRMPVGRVELVECPVAYTFLPIAGGKVFSPIQLPYVKPPSIQGGISAIRPIEPQGNIARATVVSSGTHVVRFPLVEPGDAISGLAVAASGIAYISAQEMVEVHSRGRSGSQLIPMVDPVDFTAGTVGPPIWYSRKADLSGALIGSGGLVVASRSDVAVVVDDLLPVILKPGIVNESPTLTEWIPVTNSALSIGLAVALSADGSQLYVFVPASKLSDPSNLYSVHLHIDGNRIKVASLTRHQVPPGIWYRSMVIGPNNRLFILEASFPRRSIRSKPRMEVANLDASTMQASLTIPISSGVINTYGRIMYIPKTGDMLYVQVEASATQGSQYKLFAVNMEQRSVSEILPPSSVTSEWHTTADGMAVQASTLSPDGRFLYIMWVRSSYSAHYVVTKYDLPQLKPLRSVPFSCPRSPILGSRATGASSIVSVAVNKATSGS